MKSARALALAPLQIAQALVGLGAIFAFTRLMSPEAFGHYAIALSASMLAHTLLFTWAEAAAFRFLPAARAEGWVKDHFATLTALASMLGLGVLAATGAILILTGFSGDMAALCAFAAGSAVLRFIIRIARESDRAALDVGRYALLETIYLIAGFGIGVALLVRFDLGAAAPFAGLLAAGLAVVFIDAPRLFEKSRGGSPSMRRAASYAAYGGPLALALAIDLAVQTIARLVLAAEAGADDVGAYAAAFGLARPLELIFIAGGAALAPILLAAHEAKDERALKAHASAGVTLLAAVAFPATLGLAYVATPLSALLVGDALSAEAARALPWLACAGLATGLNLYYFSEAFQLSRRTGMRALLMLAPGAVQLPLTAALAGAHGAIGAAMAAASGAAVGLIVLAIAGQRILALPIPLAALARVAAATAVMGAALALVSADDLPARVMTGVLAYAGAAIALNVADVRALIDAGLLRFCARFLPFSEPTHAR